MSLRLHGVILPRAQGHVSHDAPEPGGAEVTAPQERAASRATLRPQSRLPRLRPRKALASREWVWPSPQTVCVGHRHKRPSYLPQKCSPTRSEKASVETAREQRKRCTECLLPQLGFQFPRGDSEKLSPRLSAGPRAAVAGRVAMPKALLAPQPTDTETASGWSRGA